MTKNNAMILDDLAVFETPCRRYFDALAGSTTTSFINSRRIFHGRGQCFARWEWCTVDVFAPVVLLTVFATPPPAQLAAAVACIKQYLPQALPFFAVQRRDMHGAPYFWEQGNREDLPQVVAQRGNQQYRLDFNQQNCGYFLDMEPGRVWLEGVVAAKAKTGDAKVLNLFAYTCAFSVVAIDAGASDVVNVDLSRRSLTVGRENHRLNNHDTQKVKFLGVDILKSWGKIKKMGPYDAVIVDPPSFQKGSFVATKDYQKVVRRLPELLSPGGQVLACLNAPEFSSDYLKDLFAEQAPALTFIERLKPSADFPDIDTEQQLKLLVYRASESLINAS
ncbi:class I SAM-dependent methyltransferase [Marinagarivorans algicola]|uniref:class I SAM-dependent methyltransferase n=1 Tax=Marinagarivorans algicola TaxID=1513270 RepID=UPI000B26352B|nr:class I SAM-dependent methyltransferase [Marinagarivorans algicola]